jgi:ABC-type transport system substrate-binding protein
MERRSGGDFDIDFSTAVQEPSPSVLLQSWSCNGSTNVAKYCDPVVDSLLERALLARTDARGAWHQVLRRIEEDAPATFLYAPIYVFAVNRRFDNVAIRPESSWSSLWRWSVRSAPRVGTAGY